MRHSIFHLQALHFARLGYSVTLLTIGVSLMYTSMYTSAFNSPSLSAIDFVWPPVYYSEETLTGTYIHNKERGYWEIQKNKKPYRAWVTEDGSFYTAKAEYISYNIIVHKDGQLLFHPMSDHALNVDFTLTSRYYRTDLDDIVEVPIPVLTPIHPKPSEMYTRNVIRQVSSLELDSIIHNVNIGSDFSYGNFISIALTSQASYGDFINALNILLKADAQLYFIREIEPWEEEEALRRSH